jgi:hypothetical protein
MTNRRTESGKNNRRSFDCAARKGAIHFAQDDDSFCDGESAGNGVAKAKAKAKTKATAKARQLQLQMRLQQRIRGSFASL